MIAALPALGQMTVASQAEAIELERMVRRHVFAWWLELDVFERPCLTTERLRRLEQFCRDAEYEQRWDDVELGWQRWLACLREGAR